MKGNVTLIIGPAGSGKSTIANSRINKRRTAFIDPETLLQDFASLRIRPDTEVILIEGVSLKVMQSTSFKSFTRSDLLKIDMQGCQPFEVPTPEIIMTSQLSAEELPKSVSNFNVIECWVPECDARAAK